LRGVRVDVSASEIRRLVRQGNARGRWESMVPPAVACYIKEAGLYRTRMSELG